ncbi:MAG: hypothetical protein AB1698_20645 [Pseudomonadota bacterium]
MLIDAAAAIKLIADGIHGLDSKVARKQADELFTGLVTEGRLRLWARCGEVFEAHTGRRMGEDVKPPKSPRAWPKRQPHERNERRHWEWRSIYDWREVEELFASHVLMRNADRWSAREGTLDTKTIKTDGLTWWPYGWGSGRVKVRLSGVHVDRQSLERALRDRSDPPPIRAEDVEIVRVAGGNELPAGILDALNSFEPTIKSEPDMEARKEIEELCSQFGIIPPSWDGDAYAEIARVNEQVQKRYHFPPLIREEIEGWIAEKQCELRSGGLPVLSQRLAEIYVRERAREELRRLPSGGIQQMVQDIVRAEMGSKPGPR